MVIEKPK